MVIDRHQPPNRKRCVRVNIQGDAHSLTFSCYRRRTFFSKRRPCTWFIDSLHQARERQQFDIWAYVIMPEHCHLLVRPREDDYSISAILSAIKIPVARRAKKFLKSSAPEILNSYLCSQGEFHFWQRGGGFDRNLIDARAIYQTIDYIHANPVRRGLAERPADWEWSSAAFYEGRRDVLLDPDVATIPMLNI